MKIGDVRVPRGARLRRKRRVGRGPGSGTGKTAGRGHKGYHSRSGSTLRPGSEGGQMPLIRRLPKRGFTSQSRVRYAEVHVGRLQTVTAQAEVTPDALRRARVVRSGRRPVKVLGGGELSQPLRVSVHACTQGARAAIEAAGGSVQLLPLRRAARPARRRTTG